MTYNTDLQSNNVELQEILNTINSLPEAGGGGSSGGGGAVETCEVTIIQQWGMNDDPELLHLYIPYYNILADGSIEAGYEYFTSSGDFEPQHSVTFTAYKNVPITIIAHTAFDNQRKFTISTDGGASVERDVGAWFEANKNGVFSLIPTADTATFIFASE